jgi:hypothetical protein
MDSAAQAFPATIPAWCLLSVTSVLQERCDPVRTHVADRPDACNLGEVSNPATREQTEVGANRHHRLHASTAAHLLRFGSPDCQDDGAKGCVAPRIRVRNPDDSILHQSRREESQHATADGARPGQADPAAASGVSEGCRKETLILNRREWGRHVVPGIIVVMLGHDSPRAAAWPQSGAAPLCSLDGSVARIADVKPSRSGRLASFTWLAKVTGRTAAAPLHV